MLQNNNEEIQFSKTLQDYGEFDIKS